jgi:hypothetical protein
MWVVHLGYRLFLRVFKMLKYNKNFQIFSYKVLWEIQRRDGGLVNQAWVSFKIIAPGFESLLNKIVYPIWQPRLMSMNFQNALSPAENTIQLLGRLHFIYNIFRALITNFYDLFFYICFNYFCFVLFVVLTFFYSN